MKLMASDTPDADDIGKIDLRGLGLAFQRPAGPAKARRA
jgi:hypothetical protein